MRNHYDSPFQAGIATGLERSPASHGGSPGGSLSIQQMLEENRQLANRLQEMEQRNILLEKIGHFPEQFRAGCVAYPDRTPVPMILRDELREDDDQPFATSGAICRSSFNVDVDNFTFLGWIDFEAYWTATAIGRPLNVHIPFRLEQGRIETTGGLSHAITALSFLWRVSTSVNDRQYQAAGPNAGAAWRSSASLDANGRYVPPAEFEFQQNDTVIVEAQPLAANANGEVCRMFCSLNIYKMYEPRKKLR